MGNTFFNKYYCEYSGKNLACGAIKTFQNVAGCFNWVKVLRVKLRRFKWSTIMS